jgi:hypothetical protein
VSAYTTAVARIFALLADPGIQSAVEGRIYEGVAPLECTHPLILVQASTSYDLPKMGLERGASRVDISVRVVAANVPSLTAIEPVYDAIDRALILALPDRSARGWVNAIERVRETQVTEYGPNGDVYRYLGGVYRVLVS